LKNQSTHNFIDYFNEFCGITLFNFNLLFRFYHFMCAQLYDSRTYSEY
jgi:hypothetical protein